MFGSYGALLLSDSGGEYRLVELAVEVALQRVLQEGDRRGGARRDRDADGVDRDLLEAFQLDRAGEEREPELFLPQVRGLALVDRHARLRAGAQQVIEVRADNAGGRGLRRRVQLRESLQDSQRLQRRAVALVTPIRARLAVDGVGRMADRDRTAVVLAGPREIHVIDEGLDTLSGPGWHAGRGDLHRGDSGVASEVEDIILVDIRKVAREGRRGDNAARRREVTRSQGVGEHESVAGHVPQHEREHVLRDRGQRGLRERGLYPCIAQREPLAFLLACLTCLVQLSCHGDHLPSKSSPAVAPARRARYGAAALGPPRGPHINGGAEGRRGYRKARDI